MKKFVAATALTLVATFGGIAMAGQAHAAAPGRTTVNPRDLGCMDTVQGCYDRSNPSDMGDRSFSQVFTVVNIGERSVLVVVTTHGDGTVTSAAVVLPNEGHIIIDALGQDGVSVNGQPADPSLDRNSAQR